MQLLFQVSMSLAHLVREGETLFVMQAMEYGKTYGDTAQNPTGYCEKVARYIGA